jgi:cytochrome c-type biogenesis protein CcmH/NrfF
MNNYGEWILMTPALSKANYILWFGPVIFLVFGIILMYRYIIRKNN